MTYRTCAAAVLAAACLAFGFLVPTVVEAGPGASAPGVRASPPMWRLADADSEIWLLGTFHFVPKGLDWRSPELVAALDAAETMWFEMEADSPAVQEALMRVVSSDGRNPPGQTLSGMLEAEDADRLAGIAGELGLPLSNLDPVRPWLAALTLTVQFVMSQGFDPASAVDLALLAEARARGRRLAFFETAEQQFAFFARLDPATEKDMLVVTLRDWDRQKRYLDELFEAWRSGDTEALDRILNEVMRTKTPEVYEVLVVRRNEAWAGEIAEVMAGSGRVLVAVGAAHLVGERSVPALLRERGFVVERYGAP